MTETNEERLERIELRGQGLEDEDFEWLIQQTERAQDLERAIESKSLIVQNRHFIYSGPDDSVSIEILKENTRLREALEFYADKKNMDTNYVQTVEGDTLSDTPLYIQDGGEIARKTLEELK